jgi:tRNA G46 methylase TrmB
MTKAFSRWRMLGSTALLFSKGLITHGWSSSHGTIRGASSTGRLWKARPRVSLSQSGNSNTNDGKGIDDTATPIASNTTRYTIVDCPATDPELLQATVHKLLRNYRRYVEYRPVAAHTQEAFAQLQAELARIAGTSQQTSQQNCKFILDAGCGTGRSSLVLGERFPDHIIVGVDRSLDRLGRVARDLTLGMEEAAVLGEEVETGEENDVAMEAATELDVPEGWKNDSLVRQHVQRVSPNVILVRAELMHFWRLWLEHGYKADRHFILYPNPYPKASRLKQRWYAHSAWPLLLQVSGGRPLIVRSNWRQYLDEFAQAVVHTSHYPEEQGVGDDDGERSAQTMSDDKNPYQALSPVSCARLYTHSAQVGPLRRIADTEPWTNFEAKYDQIGEATYELHLNSSIK